MTKVFLVTTNIWMYPGHVSWHFVTIPVENSKEIDEYFSHAKRGWGSLKVTVTVGKTNWDTSIFPDKKTHTYLLPIKKEVRQREQLHEGDEVQIRLEIHD